ncbi:hypothetical protein EON66_04690 [archaeon]|nr:MAG: hypothetical protein EON66_04690 [archaeon]
MCVCVCVCVCVCGKHSVHGVHTPHAPVTAHHEVGVKGGGGCEYAVRVSCARYLRGVAKLGGWKVRHDMAGL